MNLLDGIAKAIAKKLAPTAPLTAAQPGLMAGTGIGVVDGILSSTSITITMNGTGLLPCNCATDFNPSVGQPVFVQIYGAQLYAVCPVSEGDQWITPDEFTNSWTNAFGVSFIRHGYLCKLSGTLGAGTAGNAAFMLPNGFRPTRPGIYACVATGGSLVALEILTTGEVVPTTSSDVAIDGVTFSTT